ncbi:MAG: 30S ribosomal protein S16 [bacterium]|nr:30S ribosomal protein S16 [bacterium]
MLNIRLQRVGRKNDPSFRVIVADSKLKPKTGNVLEILGSYNARMGKPIINLDRTKHWMSVGAKASGTVHNLLIDLKAVTGKKINVLNKKTPIVKEVAEAPKTEVKAPAPEVVAEKTEEAVAAPEAVVEAPAEVVAEAVVVSLPK